MVYLAENVHDTEKYRILKKFADYFSKGVIHVFQRYPIIAEDINGVNATAYLEAAEKQFNDYLTVISRALQLRKNTIRTLSTLLKALSELKNIDKGDMEKYYEQFVIAPLYSYLMDTRELHKLCGKLKLDRKTFEDLAKFPQLTLDRINYFYEIINEKNNRNDIDPFFDDIKSKKFREAEELDDKAIGRLNRI